MRLVSELAYHFRDIHLWWLGPLYPVLRLVHPNFVAPLLQAPGISSRSIPYLYPTQFLSCPLTPLWTSQAEQTDRQQQQTATVALVGDWVGPAPWPLISAPG